MSRRVAVLGLGVTGEAVARSLAVAGDDVLVVEDTPGSAEYERRVTALGALGVEIVESPTPERLEHLLSGRDLLVVSPGVPERHALIVAAQARGLPVRAEVDLAAGRAAARGVPLVAVTGTNGKTTVTTLVTSMLVEAGVHAVAAGNIGDALIEAVETDAEVVVGEVSSFQLRFTSSEFRPRAAVLLNVAPDHLDWHGTFDRYAAAKARIFEQQHDHDLLVYNADDAVAAELAGTAPARRLGYSTSARPGTFHADQGSIVDAAGDTVVSFGGLALLPHDVGNALAAAAVATEFGAPPEALVRALQRFRRLPHRVALVGDAGGVRFFDDSKATNPHATLAALRAFEEPVVLIAGGLNKGLDLSVLSSAAPRVRGVVAIGSAAPEVERAFAESVPVVRAESMHDAVAGAVGLAHPGDVVLLSPACASFDWYGSYTARGDDFADEVRGLADQGSVSA